jgi:RHS repeat-associated protein
VNGTEHPYKYNGKEHNQELGLDWYDYGWRNYNPAIGRWMNIDPLAEVYSPLSPYNYTANNPVRFVDYDGEDFGVEINHKDKTLKIKANLYFKSSEDLAKNLNAILQWNDAEGTYSNKDGESYSVSFEISGSVAEEGSDEEAAAKKDRIGNFVTEQNDSDFESGYTSKGGKEKVKDVGGYTSNNKNIFNKTSVANDQTRAHEIGHLFGLGENSGGVMDYKEDFSSLSNVTTGNLSTVVKKTLKALQRLKKGQTKKLRALKQHKREGFFEGTYKGSNGFFKTKPLSSGVKINKKD